MGMHKEVLWMVYFKQDKKMSNMEKSYSFHSNHIVTIEYFVIEGCTTRKPVILLCIIYIPDVNISNVTMVVGDGVVTLQ